MLPLYAGGWKLKNFCAASEKSAANAAQFLSKIWIALSRPCPESGVKLQVNGLNLEVENLSGHFRAQAGSF
jgi:hypothetical protein